MMNLPLHPAVVHLPLGIAAILPLVALGVTVAIWRGRWPRSAWAVVVALQLLLVGGAALALWSGEQEEERVERVITEAPIEAHEERAQVFLWAAAALLLPSLGALALKRDGARRSLMSMVAGGSLAVAGLAAWTGHSGGQLVYKHGAASAHISAPGTPSPSVGDAWAGPRGQGSAEEDDD